MFKKKRKKEDEYQDYTTYEADNYFYENEYTNNDIKIRVVSNQEKIKRNKKVMI